MARKCPRVACLAVLAGLLPVAVLALAGCRRSSAPSRSEIEDAQAQVEQVQQTLLVPDGARLITSTLTYATNPRLYPGCVVGMYYASYETTASFDEVLDAYRTGLLGQGWQLSPDHQHGLSDYEVLVSGPQLILEIARDPLIKRLVPRATPASGSSATVYYIGLSYYNRSRHECSEG